ncbi:MAG: MBL fold metallo-hydrolase [Gemmatimonadota bacterium]|nr:MBL fold metallo-hydrolase [Gemmatimonadota bacterium]
MKRIRSLALALPLFVVACTGGEAEAGDPQGAPAEPAGDPARYETTEVADGVYQFRFVGHNALFVVTDDGVVAFDPISVEAASAYAGEIRKHAPGVGLAAIVYSHRDADHATGANALRQAMESEAPIHAHENALAPLVESADPDLPPPDETFTDQASLAGGAVELHYLGRSHSDDMAVGFLPEHGIAFAVDFVAADRFGYRDLSSFYFPDMHDAIAGLLEIPFERIIFGHGPPGDRATIERQLQYYRDLEDLVRTAVDDGLTEDETAEEVLLSDYANWDRYDDWREMNVRGMYRKLSEGR